MDSHGHHSTPSISIFMGATFGIFNYLIEHNFFVDGCFQVFKIIIFGIIGGASGYLGKMLIIAINRKIKARKT